MASRRRHFGSVRKLPSGRWQASYWHNVDRHTAPYTFVSKADAQAWLSTVETDIVKGGWTDPSRGRMTVDQLAEHWLARNPSKRTSTLARDETILRRHIRPTLGAARIHEVTPPDIQILVNRWAKDRAPRTVSRQYAVLRAMFAYAVKCRWLALTPCEEIKLPGAQALGRPEVSPKAVAAIAAAMDERYRPMVWLGAVLGLRWAEAAGLTMGALDILGRTVTISHQLTRERQLTPPKSKAGQRRLTLPGPLVEVLASHLGASGLTAANPDALLFVSPEGTPLHYSNWRRRVWAPAVAAAGLAGLGFHDLRRTTASEMVALGIDVKTAQTRLGHSSVRVTLDVYARALGDADRAAADSLGERFFGASRTQRARRSGSSTRRKSSHPS